MELFHVAHAMRNYAGYTCKFCASLRSFNLYAILFVYRIDSCRKAHIQFFI